jgi:mitochondrial import receptor subunit TOM40
MAEMDVSGGTWMGNLKYGSAGGGLVYGGNYFQSITPRLAVGVEGIYMGANGALMNNYGLRYTIPAKTGEEDLEILLKPAKAGAPDTSGSSTFYASANSQGYSFNYRRVVTPGRVTFASELQVSPALQSMTTLGAEFKLARSKYSLVVDQSAHIQAVLEAQLGIAHGSPLLQFSAEMNPLNNDESKFGFGLNIQG